MKQFNVLLFFFSSIFILSCKQDLKKDEDSPIEHETETTIHSMEEGDLEILTIDGCEYIVYKESVGANHGFGYMAHKGNCINPIHCRINTNDPPVNDKEQNQ